MATISHPFQCITAVRPFSESQENFGYLLVACGPKLVSTRLHDGEIVSQWISDAQSGQTLADDNDKPDDAVQERPAKKQKTSSGSQSPSNVIKLTVAPNNQHAVVVTDDKCLRVFEISAEGKISELSQRFMPKRPCAIQVLPDNATILCGDKFGDVYSLPLLAQNIELDKDSKEGEEKLTPPQDSTNSFKPSASNLTVHTQRNRKALESQLKQKNLTAKTKEPLKFEHKLLLGHVSMLTDLCYAIHEVHGKQRGHIITADRDEHIRISRPPPQSHIIEGYCLGHKEFISKILVVPGMNLMISGGGDDWLGVWDWPSFKLRRKIHDFRDIVRKAAPEPPGMEPNRDPIAVSGMWLVPGKIDETPTDVLGVACEGSPVIAWLPLPELLKAADEDLFWVVENMGCPVLDIANVRNNVLVSVDERDPSRERLISLCVMARDTAFSSTRKDSDKDWRRRVSNVEKVTSAVTGGKTLDELLYGVESMRKRTYKDRADEEEDE